MTDVPGGGSGFEIASAFVSVDPDAATFEEQLVSQLDEIKYVVTIPVEADTAGLQASVDAAAAESEATIVLPVEADAATLKESVDAAAADSGAVVTVPLEADPANLAEQADAAGAAAGDSAGASFGETFSSVAAGSALFNPDEAQIDSLAAAAGETSGASFAEKFSSVASSSSLFNIDEAQLDAAAATAGETSGETFAQRFASVASAGALFNVDEAGLTAAAGVEGEEAGASFVSRFTSVLAGLNSAFAGLLPAAETESAAAGEAAGATFTSRFAAALSSLGAALTPEMAGMEAEGATAGAATGEGFVGSMKSVLMGGLSPMEALMGAGFIAVAADMASKFQAAMEMIHTQAGVGQSAIAGLSSQVLDLAGKVGETPDSLAQALYHVESSFQSVGISGSAAMNLLQTAAEGARVGGANLVDVTNALDATIASGVGGVHNYTQAMGALNAIVGAGDMTMQDLANAMGSGLMAVAKSYGQSLQQIGAALATFGDNNIRGARAATDLRMAMQAILAPIKAGEGQLNSLGLTMTSLGTTMEHHGLSAAIQEFVQHLEASKVPVSDWGQYVTDIFGKKAGVGIGVLVDQLGRLQSKLPDIQRGADGFASAWAATQATTSQKLKELEASFEALMVKIGTGLLPTVDSFMTSVTRALPGIEQFGSKLAHLVSPVVKDFFTGLEAVLKVLLGPLRSVTEAVAIAIVTFAGIMKLVEIFNAVKTAFIALQVVLYSNPFILLAAAVVALAFLIIKYHTQIWDFIQKVWHDIASFFDSIAPTIFKPIEKAFDDIKNFITSSFDDVAKPVEKVFDDIKTYITKGFDVWWKSHGKEIEQVWKVVWDTIKLAFKTDWDGIVLILQTAWNLIEPLIKVGLAAVEGAWKLAWDTISLYVKTVWDVIAAVVKVAVALVEAIIKTAWDTISATVKIAWDLIAAIIKTAWDVIVGIFTVALDLLTGNWGKAWDDIKTVVTQVWNNISAFLTQSWNAISSLAVQIWNSIKGFLSTTWNAISSLATQIWNNIKAFLSSAWNDIKSTAVTVFDDLRSGIANVWNGIVADVEGFVGKIKSAISGLISSLPGSGVVGSALKAIGLAGGGIVPGHGSGDHVPALLTPGETVVSKAHSKALAGAFSAVGVPGYGAGGIAGSIPWGTSPKAFASGGIVPASMGYSAHGYGSPQGFAAGGAVPALAPALAMNGQEYGERIGGSGGISINFYGTQYPTPEQLQALVMQITSAVGVAG